MEYSRRDPDDRFEQISRSLMRWVLGPGLLSVHVGAFLITVVSLLLWNFARSPSDIWVDDPLRRWGLVVVFHATAVGAGLAAWRLMRLGESSPAPVTRASVARRAPVAASSGALVEMNEVAPRSAAASATAEEWARRWLKGSVRIVRDAVGPNTVTNGHNGNGHAASPSASSVAGPEITEWGVMFARRAREMMSSARDHLSPQARETNGSAEPETPVNPSSTWPAGTEPTRPASTNGTWPAHTNGAAHAAESAPMPESSNGVTNHRPVDLTSSAPMSTASTPDGTEDIAVTSTVSEDARWTWVEAAAAAWLARREMDDPPADPVEAPPPPSDGQSANP